MKVGSHVRIAPVLVASFMLLVLAAPIALAQTHAVPITGKYEDVYVIIGRALDSRGLPVSGGRVTIELEQEGVTAQPLVAAANCKGDFITAFNLYNVDPRGRARITLEGPAGSEPVSTTVTLDPFYRRSDVSLRLGVPWGNECASETNVWPVSASLSVRLLNRTDPYSAHELEYHARPYTGVIKLRFQAPNGNSVCPPHPQPQAPGDCETFIVDERGDLRYTFTLDQPFDAGGIVDIVLQEGRTISVAIDPATRMAFGHFEITGRGPPEGIYDTPGPGVLLALVGALVAAMAISRRRQ